MKFRAKFGSDAEFHLKKEQAGSFYLSQAAKTATFLNVFFYDDRIPNVPVIPGDLAELLPPLLPEPAQVTVPSSPEPPEEDGRWIRRTESEALAELGTLLRLASMGQLAFGQKTGIPSKNRSWASIP